MISIAQGNALGGLIYKRLRPVRAKVRNTINYRIQHSDNNGQNNFDAILGIVAKYFERLQLIDC